MENVPFVKLIRNYIRDQRDIRDPSGVFSIFSLVRILRSSFTAFHGCLWQREKWRVIDLSI